MTETPLEHFLMPVTSLDTFVERVQGVNPAADRAELVAAWRKAQHTMNALAGSEDGCADASAVLPLPPSMAAATSALAGNASMAQVFDTVPVAFGLVEFDALMASRPALWGDRLSRCEALVQGADDADERLAACCLNPALGQPELKSHWAGSTWTVVTDDPQASLRKEPVAGGVHAAPAEAQWRVVSPPPVVHVARHGGRLLLVDGHHRVRMLRNLGIGFVPCLISACDDLDDVLRVAPHLAALDVARWFDLARPPMLRDHDRPSLVHTHRACPPRRLMQLRCEAQWSSLV
ncbi:MAG: ParB-like nuclease domain-containing protein [Rubrivivax sp.]|nr:ParB-like nuclease domain-containing protein [Rubrivivax sp.]